MNLYWWSPSRHFEYLRKEARLNGPAWARLALRSGRLMKNFGDEMSPLAWTIASGSKVQWSPPAKADAIAVGSILHLALRDAKQNLLVWGTGGRQELTEQERETIKSWNVIAVRGPLTAKLTSKVGVTLGDPGLFANELLRGPVVKKPGKKVYLPHFRAWRTKEGLDGIRTARLSGFQVLTPAHSPNHIARQIAESQYVAASSLHGLIFSHALGVPALALTPPGQEPDFKYRDHYDSLGARLVFRTLEEAVSDLGSRRSLDEMPEVQDKERIAEQAGMRRDGLAAVLRSSGA